jgi:hypothetical protein
MKDDVFIGNVDELLEHVTENSHALEEEAMHWVLAKLQIELDLMVEDGILELIDGKYRQI